jgi:TonB family protein
VIPPSLPTAAPTAVAATPAKTASPAPAIATVLRVSSEPAGATIYVDNEAKGLTPFDVKEVPLGNHDVRLELEGYETKSEAVQLTADAPQAEVKIALATPAPAAPKTGTADMTSTPSGASVSIDGRVAGVTPFKGTLKPGTHSFELRKDGFEPYAGNLVVEVGKRARIVAALHVEGPKQTPEPPKEVIDPNKVYPSNEVDHPPKKVSGLPLTYPDNAPKLKSGEKVSVGVSWVVQTDGSVSDVSITQSSGKKALDEYITKMVKSYKFEPGVKKETKVKVRIESLYSFLGQ